MTLLLSFFNPISWLLSTSGFMTRSHCGPGWTGTLRATYIAANLAIALSYLAIPAMLLVLYRSKRQELPAPWMLALFAAFILLCGLTHLGDVAVFWWAPYRLYTAVFVATGLASLAAAATLPAVVKSLVKLPGREYVHALNGRLQTEVLAKEILRLEAVERERELAEMVAVLERKIAAASAEIARLDHDRRSSDWWKVQKAHLTEIREQFRAIADNGGTK